MLITSIFGISKHSNKLFYRQTFHTSFNNSMYLFFKLSLILKVMALPQPEKFQNIAKKLMIITTNHNLVEQSMVITHTKFCWSVVKKIELDGTFSNSKASPQQLPTAATRPISHQYEQHNYSYKVSLYYFSTTLKIAKIQFSNLPLCGYPPPLYKCLWCCKNPLIKMAGNSASCALWSGQCYSYSRFVANYKPAALRLLEILHFE